MQQTLTAKLIIIGSEILSGKIQDKNVQFIANKLCKLGIKLNEVRIIPDVEQEIIKSVNEMRIKCNYLFTTGGIGPTHDDITSQSIAKAFNCNYVLNKEAEGILGNHYKKLNKQLNKNSLKMAYTPENAKLIINKETGAPGFVIENVYVLAGIPFVMQAMFEEIAKELKTGNEIISRSIDIYIPESIIAEKLGEIQNNFPEVEIGSYPFIRREQWGTSIVLTSSNHQAIEKALEEIHSFLKEI